MRIFILITRRQKDYIKTTGKHQHFVFVFVFFNSYCGFIIYLFIYAGKVAARVTRDVTAGALFN